MIIWTGNEAASEQIAPTVIAAFVLMTLSVTNALIPIADAIDRIPSYVESTHRLNGVESDSVLHDETDLHGEKDYIEPKHVDIELNHVSYSYPDSNEIVLKDVSLQIKAGKKIAILGRSGTGKSTLLKLLTGALSPVNGQVVLNGERAHTNLLSKYISVLNQKPHLFDTTIGNNVRIGKPEATDEEIWKAFRESTISFTCYFSSRRITNKKCMKWESGFLVGKDKGLLLLELLCKKHQLLYLMNRLSV